MNDLLEMARNSTHFEEAMRILDDTFGIAVVEVTGGWGVVNRDATVEQKFATFAQAFAFALSLLKLKREGENG